MEKKCAVCENIMIVNNKSIKRYNEYFCSQLCRLKRVRKTSRNFNTIIRNGDVSKIIINSKKHGEFKVRIDTKNIEKIKGITWYVTKTKNDFYAYSRGILLHRLIMDFPKGKVIDHKDFNTMNCLESNLRICTQTKNAQNRHRQKNRVIKLPRNVHYRRKSGRYFVAMVADKKRIYLGAYDTKKEANLVAIEGRKKYMTHATR